MIGGAIVAHGGGPTAVLNASLAGVVTEARRHPEINALFGAVRGLDGFVEDRFFDLFAQSARGSQDGDGINDLWSGNTHGTKNRPGLR